MISISICLYTLYITYFISLNFFLITLTYPFPPFFLLLPSSILRLYLYLVSVEVSVYFLLSSICLVYLPLLFLSSISSLPFFKNTTMFVFIVAIRLTKDLVIYKILFFSPHCFFNQLLFSSFLLSLFSFFKLLTFTAHFHIICSFFIPPSPRNGFFSP